MFSRQMGMWGVCILCGLNKLSFLRASSVCDVLCGTEGLTVRFSQWAKAKQ